MIQNIVIDMRCLQHEASERGIPGHAGAAIRLARVVSPLARAARITGLIDPRLAPLPADIAAIADELRPNAYLPALPAGSLLVNPAPMLPDQDRLGRLLLDPRLAKAAFVYDFIPFDDPAGYLQTPAKRLHYSTALVWLRHYQLFLPISAPTEARLRDLLGPVRSVVTGAPISLFTGPAAQAAPPRHILMVGGDDPRKNPELLIRAHAGSALLQTRRLPLLLAGDYPPARRAEYQALAAEAGGDPALLAVPGKLPAAALRAAYRAAFCVVTPSFAEGFSLPVVEAMAAGVASLGSDIPAHALLLPEPSWRFDPRDAAALTARLERLVEDAETRRAIVARQAAIWPRFNAEAVARTIWSALETLAPPPPPPPPPAAPKRRRHLALLSPLPPERTGVADFSASLATALGRRAALTLFSSPSRAAGAAPGSGLPLLSPTFDRVICALGNSQHYYSIHQLLTRYGAACICHDARLLGFHTHHFNPAEVVAMASRELGRAVTTAELAGWAADETTREANFLDDVAAASRPLIFHNRHSVAALQARGKPAAFLPFPIYRPWPKPPGDNRAAARARLGLPADERLIASFGFVSILKGTDPALRALALLRRRGLPCRLLWVGDAGGSLDQLRRLAATHGVADLIVPHTGFLTEARYRDYLAAADAGLQLRTGRPGSVSGALQDCIAAGLPSVANNDLAETVDAPDYISRIGDQLDPADIATALAALIEAATPRAAHEAARLAYCARHAMEVYVDGLLTLLDL